MDREYPKLNQGDPPKDKVDTSIPLFMREPKSLRGFTKTYLIKRTIPFIPTECELLEEVVLDKEDQ